MPQGRRRLIFKGDAAVRVDVVHPRQQGQDVEHEQAEWLIDRLKAVDIEAKLLTLEGADHGCGGKDAEKVEKAMRAFFDRHLKKK